MISEREITSAIGAHSVWKSHLKQAISNGTLNVPLTTIEADDECQFGRWLATIEPDAKAFAKEFALVKQRHAAFHEVAGRVAMLALTGKRSVAEDMLAFHGEFSLASARLTEAMIEWKSAIAALVAR